MYFLKVFICIGAVDFYIKKWVTNWNREHWKRILKKYLDTGIPNEELLKIKEPSLMEKSQRFLYDHNSCTHSYLHLMIPTKNMHFICILGMHYQCSRKLNILVDIKPHWLITILFMCHLVTFAQNYSHTRVSVQGIESLWGDCRFIPADWGS